VRQYEDLSVRVQLDALKLFVFHINRVICSKTLTSVSLAYPPAHSHLR
jgi:hypothetical protein